MEIFEEASDKISLLESKILSNRDLRKYAEKDDRIKGSYALYLPNISRSLWEDEFAELFNDKDIIFSDELENYFINLRKKYLKASDIPDNIWNKFIRILTGTDNLIKSTRKPEKENTKAEVLRRVEIKLQLLDYDAEQIKISQQIPPGPQRIRGLAGTGKTIILAMKVAHMHFNHPDWTIVYSFNTQSLYEYIIDLIKRFYQYLSGGKDPNWSRLMILHGWGGKSKKGLYSFICGIVGKNPITFTEAKDHFEYKRNSELLGKCCLELMEIDLPKMFDAIIIDEAQDFDRNFFRFCYALLKPPKRLIWAYDELQSLENVDIPTAKDIFGIDENGVPIVELEGPYSAGLEKDFILFKSYRNPRAVLILAHIFGMGLLRKDGPIQFIPELGAWEDIGYKSQGGAFDVGKKVRLTRPIDHSPNPIEDFISAKNLITIKTFETKELELVWIADRIKDDIEKERLKPEDILIIGFNQSGLYSQFDFLKRSLMKSGIYGFIVGKDVSKDTFHVSNLVTLSTVFKAKGNETPVVYIFNFENAEDKKGVIQSRNMAFASITRTKGWCTITGTGPVMKELELELNTIISQYPEVTFTVPDMTQIKRNLDSVEYEKRRTRINKLSLKLKETITEIEHYDEREVPDETKRIIIEFAKKLK